VQTTRPSSASSACQMVLLNRRRILSQFAQRVTSDRLPTLYIMTTGSDRAKLVARLEVEARGFQNAKGTSIRDVRWGTVLGLLNAGTVLGLWSRRASGKASDAIYHRMPVRGIRKMLASKGDTRASQR
jgi:hypothetical protein